MTTFLMDVRYGVRRLAVNPGFTIAAVLTLALGIGANTAIYSVVDTLLLRPLPYRNPDTLVQLYREAGNGFKNPNLTYDDFMQWRQAAELFAQVEAFDSRSQTIRPLDSRRSLGAGAHGEPEHITTAGLTGGMMEMLGAVPLLGRTLQPADAQPGRDGVAVISYALWQRQYGGRHDAIGESIQLDDRSYEIVGVMPSAFRFPYLNRQVWVPLVPAPPSPGVRTTRYETLAQLNPGVTVTQAQERIRTVSATATKMDLTPFMDRRVNRTVEQALYAFAAAVAVLLLIATANVANLLLVQSAAREREVALRASLGAGRGRLIRQFLTETALIAIAGGCAGVVVAMWSVDLLATTAPEGMRWVSEHEIAVDRRSLAVAGALTGISALLFGTLPAIKASRPALHDALKAGGRSASDGPGHGRLRGGFVVAQLALSLVLLVAAGLLTRTFIGLTRVDPGFQSDKLLAATITVPSYKYRTPEARREAMQQYADKLRGMPGIAGLTVTQGMPPDSGGIMFGLKFEIEGRGTVLEDPELVMPYTEVEPDYFRVLQLPLLRGRTFDDTDAAGSPKVIVINEYMARQLFGSIDIVGQRFRTSARSPWYTVVGVAANVYQFDAAKPARMFNAYFPRSQRNDSFSQATIVMRTNGDPAAMIPAVKAQVWSVDPTQPFYHLDTVSGMYDEFFAEPRFYAAMMSIFGVIGVLVAAIGLYGVLSYAVAQRTREFGIRLALGATPGDILRLAIGHGGALTLVGIVLGCGASLLVAPSLASLLVDLAPLDPVTYVTVVAALGTAAAIATLVPAHRAVRTNPVTALRHE
jgi:putative ABC transport system permease protein